MRYRILATSILLLTAACGGDDKSSGAIVPPTILQVDVKDADTALALSGARVMLIDATTGAPYLSTQTTGTSGSVNWEVAAGAYLVRISAQGYDPFPATTAISAPVSATTEQTTQMAVSLDPVLNPSTLGFLSGQITDSTATAVPGVLLIASDGTNTYSATSDTSGYYAIYNLPAATYTVTAWLADYQADSSAQGAVTAGAETAGVDITTSSGATGSVTGTITFLATGNGVVDVTLQHPDSGDSIPGLQAMIDASTRIYTITGVPPGTYRAVASFLNDDYVTDPDRIIKFGVPQVTVASGAETLDFDVTGAATIISPSNTATDLTPQTVSMAAAIVFEWESYSSAKDYVIEVVDVAGNVLWGGFDGTTGDKVIALEDGDGYVTTTATGNLQVSYNADGSGTALESGKMYMWRLYVSKDDSQETLGWKLISASENLRGLFETTD